MIFKLKLRAVSRAFGQYKVPIGADVDLSVCDDKMNKYFFGPILESIGVKECPPKKVHIQLQFAINFSVF